jgi:hypothetical protein
MPIQNNIDSDFTIPSPKLGERNRAFRVKSCLSQPTLHEKSLMEIDILKSNYFFSYVPVDMMSGSVFDSPRHNLRFDCFRPLTFLPPPIAGMKSAARRCLYDRR